MQLAHDPLLDPSIQHHLEKLHQQQTLEDVVPRSWNQDSYLDAWTNWIEKSSHNTVSGLSQFSIRAYCAGAGDTISSFVYQHCRQKRIRYSSAEFVGARIASNHCGADHLSLESADIAAGDAVILSVPFSGNGSFYPNHEAVLDRCDLLGVPVLLDMAYFGISYGIEIDLDRPSISDVTFSASKFFSTPLRLGIRYRRDKIDDRIQSLHNQKIYNRWALDIGKKLLAMYSHDYIIDRYRPLQQEICQNLGLNPTPTVTLALGHGAKYKDYERGGFCRVCITDEIHQRLPK